MPRPVDPLVVRILRAHRLAIIAREEQAMRSLAAAWMRVEDGIRGEIQALVMAVDGKTMTAAQLAKMERYQRLLAQAEARTRVFADAAGKTIGDYQRELAQRGIANAAEATQAVFTDAGRVGISFSTLPSDAIDGLIGLTADGTPLGAYLRQSYPQAARALTQALLDGTAQGLEPIAIAKRMMNAYGVGLRTAINMARTETLRVYRAASQQQYEASGVVRGWKRLSAHDERVCAGCLFTEGEFYANLDEFHEHNQGRCTPVPVVIGVDEPRWVSGADWFVLQDEATQRSILGAGRFEAWQSGVGLEKMVKRVSNPVWGGAFVPTPVSELLA